MMNPASMSDRPRVSQTSVSLWVNMTVRTPSSRRTRCISRKQAVIFRS